MTVAIHLADARKHIAGFTVLEVVISIVISTVIVLATIGFIRMSGASAVEIWQDTKAQSAMRSAWGELKDDIRQSAATKLIVTRPSTDNHTIRLQHPLNTTGTEPGTVWGVYAPELGTTEVERTKPGWFIRYRVVDVTQGSVVDRQLVREYLDAGSSIRRSKILVHFLEPGTGTTPGFKVDPAGVMWQITLSCRVKSSLRPVRSEKNRVSFKNK